MSRHEPSRMESLECRRLLSAAASAHVRDGFLRVRGTTGPDALTVTETNGDVVVTDGSTQLISAPASEITQEMVFNGRGGGDTVTIGSSLTDGNLLIREQGNSSNTIDDDSNVGVFILVGNGANTINVPSPNAIAEIDAGTGADTIIAGDGTVGVVTGKGGDQAVTLGNGSDAVYYRGNGTLTIGSGGDVIVAGNGADTIDVTGTSSTTDFSYIWAGPRTVVSGLSNDKVYTGKDPSTNISGVLSGNITTKDPRRFALNHYLSFDSHKWVYPNGNG